MLPAQHCKFITKSHLMYTLKLLMVTFVLRKCAWIETKKVWGLGKKRISHCWMRKRVFEKKEFQAGRLRTQREGIPLVKHIRPSVFPAISLRRGGSKGINNCFKILPNFSQLNFRHLALKGKPKIQQPVA